MMPIPSACKRFERMSVMLAMVESRSHDLDFCLGLVGQHFLCKVYS